MKIISKVCYTLIYRILISTYNFVLTLEFLAIVVLAMVLIAIEISPNDIS